jgi:hypothetical protein
MDLSDLGPFFEVQSVAAEEQWRPLNALLAGPALDERVDHVEAFLGAMTGQSVERRVAASTMSLGLFARLVAPQMGAAVLGHALPRLSFDTCYWQPVDGGPWPLALVGAGRDADLAAALEDVLLPLVEAIAARCSLSEHVLTGNVASAVFGAVRMISSARPDLAAVAEGLGTRLLAYPLAGAGHVHGSFVRSSCCLYYRIPGGGLCGDCVLATH